MVSPRMYYEVEKYLIHPSVSISGMSLVKSPARYGQPAKVGCYDLGIRSINLMDIKLSKVEIKKLLEIDSFLAKLLQRRK